MNILVIGSSVIDLFLSVEASHAPIIGDKVSLTLGDKIPSEIKKLGLGGNAANVSVGLTRLSIPTTFYTYLGKDILSREIEEKLTAEGVELIAKRGDSENSPLHIIFDFDKDRIIFSHYPKAEHDFSYEGTKDFDFIFLNSIADYWENAYEKIFEFSNKHNIPIIFSPGSRQLENLNDTVYRIIKASKYIFINKGEAVKLLEHVNKNASDIKGILTNLASLGPKIISVTDGENGGFALDEKGEIYRIDALKTTSFIDKTGAGDAYASGFLGAVFLGKNVPEAMSWGGINASSVMQFVGAQPGLLNKEKIENELVSKPDYKAKIL